MKTNQYVDSIRFYPEPCPFYLRNQMIPHKRFKYWQYRQGPEEKYYQPNPKLVEFSQELETKVSQALDRANLSSDAGIKEFIDNILAAFADVWVKAGSDPIGKSITLILSEAHGEIAHLVSSYAPSQIIKDVAEVAGRVIKFLKIIAPSSTSLNIPVFSQTYTNLDERDERVTLSKEELAAIIGISFLSGVGITLLIQGKLVVVIGSAVTSVAAGVVWLYNTSQPVARESLELMVKYIVPFNFCFRKSPGNLSLVKTCLVNEFKLSEIEASRLIAVYDEGKVRGLSWATEKGIFIEKLTGNLLTPRRRLTPYYPLPSPYYLYSPYPLPPCNSRYFQQQFSHYRQAWEIFSCLLANKKWLKINFPEGFSVIARLDYIATDMTTGFAKRENITINCDNKTIETKEQAQSCLNKWVQVKLPNNIILRLYLTYFAEKYIGGNFATEDLLALSEKVTDIECYEKPI